MRRIFVLFCTSLLGVVLILPSVAGAATGDWPHDGASSARRHWNRDELASPRATSRACRGSTGGLTVFATVNETPIVANGRMFTVREVYNGLECPTSTD